MSQMEIDRVLAQIRNISNTARPGAPGVAGPAGGVAGIDNGFSKLLKQGLESVNATQNRATDMATKFERGVPGVELPQVMLEMQKANVSFRALTEVRNKFVEAYREIMNMPL
jgi:flagellar hook-basal body complex protein FliE